MHSQLPTLSRYITVLIGGFPHGEEEQACKRAPEASGMDETTSPRTQGSLARQDTCRENLEADQTDAPCVAHEGVPTRLTARTLSVVFAVSTV